MIQKYPRLLTPQQVFERAAEIIEPELRKIVLEMLAEEESQKVKMGKKKKKNSQSKTNL